MGDLKVLIIDDVISDAAIDADMRTRMREAITRATGAVVETMPERSRALLRAHRKDMLATLDGLGNDWLTPLGGGPLPHFPSPLPPTFIHETFFVRTFASRYTGLCCLLAIAGRMSW